MGNLASKKPYPLLNINLQQIMVAYAKAIKKILPHLMDGHIYTKLVL
jgi:hypothetical protein